MPDFKVIIESIYNEVIKSKDIGGIKFNFFINKY